MLQFFKVPKTDFIDLYDLARFKLAWRVNVFLSFALFLVSVFFSFTNSTFFFQYGTGFIIVFAGLLVLKFTHNYKAVSFFISVASLVLVISSLFIVKNVPHIIEPLWLIAISIFAYYNLGVKWGSIILACVIVGVSGFLLFAMNDTVDSIQKFNNSQLIGITVELILAMVVIGYFITTAIQTVSLAEKRLRKANVELYDQNVMIGLQNEEKTVLLQEIHHRVKNNLQVIMSLLRLQSNEINSPETKLHFNDAIGRIMTMSLIHQKMYQVDNLSKIDAEDYFNTLIYDLIHSSAVSKSIKTDMKIRVKKIGPSSIVPLALLISELVSNSLKHAFNDNGSIMIEMNDSDGYISLNYADSGDWKEGSGESFGLQLIQILTEQMEGSFERFTEKDGTLYQFKLYMGDHES